MCQGTEEGKSGEHGHGNGPPQTWGRGIVSDIKGTIGAHWISSVTNLNQKTIAVSLLLFISVISPTLTFGAVYGKATNNQMGAVEMLLGTSWVGVVYALIGGNPIAINGATGPVLAMSTALFRISESLDVPFLTFNFWVSAWMFLYLALAGFFDLNRIILYATRFTDEVFAFLIVSIFVLDALYDPLSDVGLFHYLNSSHKSHEDFENDPDYNYMATGLLSVLLGLGTTATAFFLRGFRHSAYFYVDGIRTSLFDFAVTLSVLLYTCIKHFFFDSIETESLNVPESFGTTFECCDDSCTTFFPDECPDLSASVGTRPWMVDPFDLNGKSWVPFMAAGPAVLSFFLIFLDNGITWHIINHKSHKLQHGESYNYDTLLSGLFNFVNGMLGLPWLVATTVPCIIHLHALADKDKDGKFRGVQETRLTGFLAHLLMALSMLALNLLKLIPLPVLYGVFLFMGLAALRGIQFWERMLMFLQQPSKYNQAVPFIQYMKPKRIHMYTVFQIMFFAGVFAVQNIKAISIAFPFMTLMCIPGRLFLLPRFFKDWELTLLDGNEEDIQAVIESGKLEEVGNKEVGVTDAKDVDFGSGESYSPGAQMDDMDV